MVWQDGLAELPVRQMMVLRFGRFRLVFQLRVLKEEWFSVLLRDGGLPFFGIEFKLNIYLHNLSIISLNFFNLDIINIKPSFALKSTQFNRIHFTVVLPKLRWTLVISWTWLVHLFPGCIVKVWPSFWYCEFCLCSPLILRICVLSKARNLHFLFVLAYSWYFIIWMLFTQYHANQIFCSWKFRMWDV